MFLFVVQSYCRKDVKILSTNVGEKVYIFSISNRPNRFFTSSISCSILFFNLNLLEGYREGSGESWLYIPKHWYQWHEAK